jgi:hypothetical protein
MKYYSVWSLHCFASIYLDMLKIESDPGWLRRYGRDVFRFPEWIRNFSLLHSAHTNSGAHLTSNPINNGWSFPGGKAAEA